MFHLIAAAALTAAPVQVSADTPVTNLIEVFAATCLNGEAKLQAGDAEKISFDQLPRALRTRLGTPVSGNVWRLNTSGRAYLYILNFAPGAGVDPKICGLASDEMRVEDAVDMLDLRLAGAVSRARQRSMQWVRPQDGYIATATAADQFKVVQVNWLSEEAKQKMIDDLSSVAQ